MKKKIIKIVFAILGILLLAAIGIGGYMYSITSTGFDIDKTVYIFIDTKKDYNNLLKDIEHTAKVENISDFDKVASWLNYKSNVKAGRYAIKPGMTVMDAVRVLRSGAQAPIKITFNNMRTREDLARRLSEQLMVDSTELLMALEDEEIGQSYGFTPETFVSMFIPNTYEAYWDISVESFLKRMNKEYKKFWNEDRSLKAEALGLTPVQVSTLAAIVEEECTFSDEYPIVAGLYLNRLNRKQLLQADPTVKFAVGDFGLRRVLNKHLDTDSPYNTYKYLGLPPGPIRIPSIKGIDGILNHAEHDYLYMCAKEDFSGRHNYAKTLREHNNNAAKYRAELNRRRIYQ